MTALHDIRDQVLPPLSWALRDSRVSMTLDGKPSEPVTVRVLGPGDITGIDPAAVARVEPPNLSVDVETTAMPFLEFSDDGLPWMFSPPQADGTRWRPWIGLVVVEESAADYHPGGGEANGIISLGHSEWQQTVVSRAHALAIGAGSRLFAATSDSQALQSNTRYLAALVPTTREGRATGLGLPEGADLGEEWPVYYAWSFSTGPEGDFPTLAKRLQPIAAPLTAGAHVELPWKGAQGAARESLVFPGALGKTPGLPDGVPGRFATHVAETAHEHATPMPIYGDRHAAGIQRPWSSELNSDPRWRSAASWGVRIVQERQEEFMAQVWRQVGELEAANHLRRRAQAAVRASQPVNQWLNDRALSGTDIDASDILSFTAPVLDTVAAGHGRSTTVANALGSAGLAWTSPAARRLMARQERTTGVARVAGSQVVGNGLCAPDPHAHGPGDDESMELDKIKGEWNSDLYPHPDWDLLFGPRPEPPPPPDWQALSREVVDATDPSKALGDRLDGLVHAPPDVYRCRPDEPDRAGDDFDELMSSPRIDVPLAEELIRLAPSVFLPGLEGMPTDSVTATFPNPRFIEALMVGANHEFNRELLWRGFPTDCRGTPFRRFWDRSAHPEDPPENPEELDDIDPIHRWSGGLGKNLREQAREPLVVLLRGQLLLRYPTTHVYLVQARWRRSSSSDPWIRSIEEQPIERPYCRGRIDPDITYAGFAISAEDALGPANGTREDEPAGWYLVLEQADTSLRFTWTPGQGAAGQDEDPLDYAAHRVAQPYRQRIHLRRLLREGGDA